ncbi:transcription factor with AP2 domain(s), putative, partial [Plasmodium malariae]
ELLSVLLPQPPAYPPLEIWLFMSRKNAAQLHKIHLTIYIMYQKIIYNFSNILLQINNDMLKNSNKSKFYKRSGTDSLNDYVYDNKEEHLNHFARNYKIGTMFSKNNEYISEKILLKKKKHDDSPFVYDNALLLSSARSRRGGVRDYHHYSSDGGGNSSNFNDINYGSNSSNGSSSMIPKRCLFEINRKIENIMKSINDITDMINMSKGVINSSDHYQGSGNNTTAKSSSFDSVDRHDGTDDSNNWAESTNGEFRENENDVSNKGKNIEHGEMCMRNGVCSFKDTNKLASVQTMDPLKNVVITKHTCRLNEKQWDEDIINNQIFAYDDIKNSYKSCVENMSCYKLDINNNPLCEENPQKLLEKIKYELREVYNEICNLNKYDQFILTENNKKLNNFLGLVKSKNDKNTTISDIEVKLDNTSYINDLTFSGTINYNNPAIDTYSSDYYYQVLNNKTKKRGNNNKQNKLINEMKKGSIFSNDPSKDQGDNDEIDHIDHIGHIDRIDHIDRRYHNYDPSDIDHIDQNNHSSDHYYDD